MARIIEDTAGKTRDLPIADSLRRILAAAANDAGVAIVRVISGGQCAKGTCTKRVGSTRHDLGNAADLQLENDGRVLAYTQASEKPAIEKFLECCAAYGATGIGCGPGYMGGKSLMHVGFGSKVVWGKDGKSANAPQWVKDAVQRGWDNPKDVYTDGAQEEPAASTITSYEVIARNGLNLRGGLGTEFDIIRELPTGTRVIGRSRSGAWVQVDVEGDGQADGYVHGSYLRQITATGAGMALDSDAYPSLQLMTAPPDSPQVVETC